MSITIPSYPNPCLAADDANNAIYLVGVSPAIQGRLEVNYVSMIDVNAPISSPVGTQVNTNQWSSGAPKACFIHPATTYANRPLSVTQFGNNVSYSTLITPSGTILGGSKFINSSFVSPKLFALTGSVAPFDWLVTLTTDAVSPWAAVRLNFSNPDNDLQDPGLTNYPTSTPLIAVGTYSTVPGPPSKGYAVVFDKLGQGQIFASTGSVTATIANDVNVMVLSAPTNVQMNSIKLTDEAVPVTMTTTGYILDKAPDNSTVIYAITPETSSSLQRVDTKGGSPPFSKSYAATALNKQIVTYTPSVSGNPTINSFDTTTQTWSGPGLMNNNITTAEPSGVPIGAIIGGAVGGLLVIALAIIFCVRHRRKSQLQQQKPTAPAITESLESGRYEGPRTANVAGGGGDFGVQKDQLQEMSQMQQIYYYQPQTYEQVQGHYPPSPATFFIPPPPPVNPNAVKSFEVYRPTSIDEAPSESNSTPYGSLYISPSPNAYRVSTVSAQTTPVVSAAEVAAVATTGSPEHSYAKSRVSSYGGSSNGTPLSPQLYAEDEKGHARSPHTFASLSPSANNS
ncbi:hypothetical protein BKA57DRAFT_461309 [Linnemannia elongata]|nr:hypothetical protein BKA57DRAFT_461309 [Linnemannia elongata]